MRTDGRRVRLLLDGVATAGVRSFVWDGRDDAGRALPAGVYLTRVNANGAAATGRVVIVR